MRRITRPEDMSGRGRMTLLRDDDGDMGIMLVEDDGTSADVEFCASGGHSPWTLQALYALQEAMEKDERREPWPVPELEIEEGTCPRTGEVCGMDCEERPGGCWAEQNDVDVSG